MAKRYFMDTYYVNGEVSHDEYTEAEAREVLRNHDVMTWANTEEINTYGVIKYVRYVEDSETIGEVEMNFYRLVEKVQAGDYTNKMSRPIKTRYSESTIFDENESVIWNREQVKIRNEENRNVYRARLNHDIALAKQFNSDCILSIVDRTGLSEEKAKLVYNRAYDEGHSDGYESVVDCAEDYCSFISKILEP